MTTSSSAAAFVRRFGYPLILLAVAFTAIAARLLGLSLMEPAATAAAILIGLIVATGTAFSVAGRDDAVLTASVAATTLLGPLAGGLFQPAGLRFQLLGLVLLASLLVLLVALGWRTPGVPRETGRSFAGLRAAVMVIGFLALMGGVVVGGLGFLIDRIGFDEPTREEFPSPDGSSVLVSEYHDAGAMGSSTRYYVARRALPLVARRIEVPFDDGYEHDTRWVDADHLQVDGLTWTVGGPAPSPKTTTRGVEWTSQASGTRNTLFSVRFVDARTGWTVGDFGTALKTTDGGASWNTVQTGTSDALYSVWFADADTGWIVTSAGGILHTTDGGATWTRQQSGTKQQLFAVRFVDRNTGWVVGEGGAILRTADGGTTWSRQVSGTTAELTCVDFFDARTAWAAGERGVIVKTTDGGATWRPGNSPSGSMLEAVFFLDRRKGWAVGEAGTILKTIDGGVTWSEQPSGQDSIFEDVYFTDSNTGWVVGTPAKDGQPGTVLMTSDGGRTWTLEPAAKTDGLYAVSFVDRNTGFAVGEWGAMLRTEGIGARQE